MTTPTYAVGQPITTGALYRLVPNWLGFWEYDAGRPSPRAFRKDPDDDGVSMYLKGPMAQDELERRLPDYAICELDIEVLCREGLSVIYDGTVGDEAHVLVRGVTKSKAKALARRLAKIMREPGPMKEPDNPHSEDD